MGCGGIYVYRGRDGGRGYTYVSTAGCYFPHRLVVFTLHCNPSLCYLLDMNKWVMVVSMYIGGGMEEGVIHMF